MAVLKNIPVQAKINGSKVNIGKAMTVNGKVNPSRAVVPKGAIPTVLTPGKSLLKGNSALPTALTPAKFFLKENQSLPSPATSQKSILKENSVLFTAKTEQAAHKENEAKPQYYSMPFLDVDEKTGEDEINNVAAMGGVNVVEESQKSIASVGTQIRSCQDEYLVPMSVMQARLKASVAKHDLEEPSAEVACLINHAVQERLKTLIEKLAVTAKSRVDNTIKTDKRYEVTQDVRGQLRFLEELDYAERKKRREEERERLLRAAKARARNGDPDHAELKAKAKKLKRAEEEEHQQREANLTALQAIGPRKKPRLDLAALTGRSHPPPPKRINQRDLLNLLEQERGSSCSLMLFKSYLK